MGILGINHPYPAMAYKGYGTQANGDTRTTQVDTSNMCHTFAIGENTLAFMAKHSQESQQVYTN